MLSKVILGWVLSPYLYSRRRMNQSKKTKNSPMGKATIILLFSSITLQIGPIAHLIDHATHTILTMNFRKDGTRGTKLSEEDIMSGPKQYPIRLIFYKRELKLPIKALRIGPKKSRIYGHYNGPCSH